MKELFYIYPNNGLKCMEVEEPKIVRPNDVKIKIEYAAICGSDLHIIDGSFDYMFEQMGFEKGIPIPLGHEAAGTVVAIGKEVKNCKIGDKVTFNNSTPCGKCHYCRNGMENMCDDLESGYGGMKEYAVVPDKNVYILPEGISTRTGCISEPLSVAMGAIERANIKPGESVAIFGGGPIGMLVLQLAKLSGAYPITLFDITEEKLNFAKKLGADYAINSLDKDACDEALKLTNSIGYHKIIECSGTTKVLDMCMKLLSKSGCLIVASAYSAGAKYSIDFGQFFMRNLSISATYCQSDAFERSVTMLNRIDINNTITAEYPLNEYEEGFKAHKNGKNVKVIFKVND